MTTASAPVVQYGRRKGSAKSCTYGPWCDLVQVLHRRPFDSEDIEVLPVKFRSVAELCLPS